MHNEKNENEAVHVEDWGTKTGALIKLGLITAGTQVATEVIHRLARYPLAVFGLGVLAGVYTHKHRNKIIHTARQIQHQGKNLLTFQSDDK